VTAEISLENAPVLCPIEHRAPGFQFAHPIGRFLSVQFGHAPLIHVLATAHGISEVHFPVVAIINVAKRRRDSTLSHDGVGFAQERFAN
jgi:hypothetical protein